MEHYYSTLVEESHKSQVNQKIKLISELRCMRFVRDVQVKEDEECTPQHKQFLIVVKIYIVREVRKLKKHMPRMFSRRNSSEKS